MALSVCPADHVSAPVERVWDLLIHPADYDRFLDMTVASVEPPGRAVVGQRVTGWTREFGRRWRIAVEVEEVDEQRHQILFRAALPFGVIGNNRISCERIDEQRCLVRFG